MAEIVGSCYGNLRVGAMLLEQTERLRSELKGMFYDVGQPFKDNTLKMNNRQMKWCFKIMELIEQLHVNY